jgi:CBS-domain-containing membrane protein
MTQVAGRNAFRHESEGRTMKIAEIMSREVVSLKPEDSILEATRLMGKSCASCLPVVDESGALIGLLTERDLIARLGTRRRSWWETVFGDSAQSAREYQKLVGTTVAEVMSPLPVSASPELSVEAAADLLSQDGIRELPVVADGRLVGNVSRTALLQVLAKTSSRTGVARTDAELVAEMKNRLAAEDWVSNRALSVLAKNGVLSLFGLVESEEEKTALGVMARTIEGCTGVENNVFPKSQLRGRGWV